MSAASGTQTDRTASGSGAATVGAVRPDHVDGDGGWWALEALPRWWVRADGDGTLWARHRDGRVRDQVVLPGADEPARLLVAKCGTAEFAAAHPDLGGRAGGWS